MSKEEVLSLVSMLNSVNEDDCIFALIMILNYKYTWWDGVEEYKKLYDYMKTCDLYYVTRGLSHHGYAKITNIPYMRKLFDSANKRLDMIITFLNSKNDTRRI